MLKGVRIEELNQIARLAGEEILAVYASDFAVDFKDDESPLTEADQRSNAAIVNALQELTPTIPILSEEMKVSEYSERKDWDYFWWVDPLDGTKEFVKKNGEFTVNIALIRGSSPVAGVVYQPVGDHLYWAEEGQGAWKSSAGGAPEKLDGGEHYLSKREISVVASRSHQTPEVTAFVSALQDEGKEIHFLSAGSSLKLCLVAEGLADVYPRLGPTMEWDTAAAHAVAVEAGRDVLCFETKEPLRYNKENLLNPHFIVE